MHYVKTEIEKARHTNLYEYLRNKHFDEFTLEGGSLRLKKNHSISIAPNYVGFYDFGTRESGDAIKFLMDYLGYTFQEAVKNLLAFDSVVVTFPENQARKREPDIAKEIILPKKNIDSQSRVIAYLLGRGICIDIILKLIKQGLLYQSADTNNCVFVNYEKDYLEQRGTITKEYLKAGTEPFRQVKHTLKSNFWYMTQEEIPFSEVEKILVCEAAIDAISLYQILNKEMHTKEKLAYVSIGGVANQETIERLVATGKLVVLAVDNDKAGEDCRKRNRKLPYLLPTYKDWNEELKLYKK